MLAKCTGLFRLSRDAELRYGTSGNAILKLNLVCSEKFKEKETTLFLDAVAFGKVGEIINQYAGTKGTQLFLSGKLQTDTWDKDGAKQYKISMVVEGFEFVSNKTDNQQQRQEPPVYYEQQVKEVQQLMGDDIDQEIIPF